MEERAQAYLNKTNIAHTRKTYFINIVYKTTIPRKNKQTNKQKATIRTL